jgi:ubiquilin
MLSNPAVMEQIINSNPMLRQMVDANPSMRALLTNPGMIRTMMTPENINAAMNLMGPGGAEAGGLGFEVQ